MAKTARSKTSEFVPAADTDLPVEKPRNLPTEDEIAVRAYHIYLERGGSEGDPQSDWLQAERELTQAQE